MKKIFLRRFFWGFFILLGLTYLGLMQALKMFGGPLAHETKDSKIIWAGFLKKYVGSPLKWEDEYEIFHIHEKLFKSENDISFSELLKINQKLKNLSGSYKGSNILYLSLLEVRRRRILEECGGVGERAWELKKLCLVLLTASAIETLEELRPTLLLDVGERLAVLSSLDGLTRVASVEGTQSPTLKYFFEALDAINLVQERKDFENILKQENRSLVEIITLLRDLRAKIEYRMNERFTDLRMPASFKMNAPGPLEQGI